MALINTIIPKQNFELVRDRIGEILADELANQFTLSGDAEINAKVFLERFLPIDKTSLPSVNVMLSRGNYENHTTIQSVGNYSYFIDVYTRAKTSVTSNGDSLSLIRLQRLLGVCKAILENPKYKTLAFVPPYLNHTSIESIEVAEPRNNQDASSVMMGRLTFNVVVRETTELTTPNNISGWETSVQLGDSGNGYVFSNVTV